ncbi:MAG: T9SS type A sorting domain-containing protein [Flavobacteriales bacterium]|nr:T9SS type A sorting domain-containing protein [Flavobacteriales bacterium]
MLGFFLFVASSAMAQPPANDDCNNATLIGDGPTPFVTSGATGADITSCTFSDNVDVWFRYVASCTGVATATTCGAATYDTALAAFSACGGAELACNDDACGLQSTITFNVTAGTSYWVRVSGYNGASGSGTLTMLCQDESSFPANNDCSNVTPTAIAVPGSDSFSGDSFGATDSSIGASYGAPQVWEAFTITECADVTIDLCGSPQIFDPMFIGISSGCPAGFPDNYVFSTSWAFSCADGNISMFFYNLQPGSYWVPVIAQPGGPYTLNISTVACAGAPSNDDCNNAILIGDGATPFSNLGSTGTDITSCAFNDNTDVWFRYVATCDGTATATTCAGATFDTTLGAFSACDGAELACNDDACGLQSTVTFAVTAGTSYWIRVAGYNGAVGDGTLTLSCSSGPPPPGGPCCTAHTGTGCENAACQAAICAADPFCCDTQWDGLCAGDAVANANSGGVCNGVSDCPGGPPPPGGTCCTAHPGTGCSDAACQALICAADPFCCNTQWDGICAGAAVDNALAGGVCADVSDCPGFTEPPANNDCSDVTPVAIPVPGSQGFTGNSLGGTDTSVGQSYGAAQVWEAFTITECADVTLDLCGSSIVFDPMFIGISSGCPAEFPGNFIFANSWAFSCPNANIVATYLNLQPGTYWVPIISQPGGPYVLNISTAVCGEPPPGGPCCSAHPGIGCEDAACQAAICANDAFCCSTQWDGICAGAAVNNANIGGVCNGVSDCPSGPPPPGDGPCCTANGTPGCEDPACQAVICANDPFCCNTQWDGICAGAAVNNANVGGVCNGASDCPSGPPPPGDGPCCTANGTPGCEDPACQALICAADPFCCNTQWDGLCAGAALNNAVQGGVCADVSDCPGFTEPPANNDCDDVVPVLIPVPGADTFTGNSLGGTDSSVGQTYGAPQVWEAFTITECADVTIDLCGSPIVFDPMFIGISSGCPAEFPGNFIFSTSWSFTCSDGNIILLYLNLQPGTYWVPVISQPGGPYVLNVSTVPCGSTPTGPCCSANGTPGCDDAGCQAVICAADPFCCDTAWDGICAGAAIDNANAGGVCAGVTDCPGSTDCEPVGAESELFEKISNVTFSDLNNDSDSNAGYEDFTELQANVELNVTYPISVTGSNTFSEDQVYVWIDWNQNGTFEDTELAFVSAMGVGPYTGDITIPGNAVLGVTKMRVRLVDMHDGSSYPNVPNNTPCGLSTYGQVEDYSVKIEQGVGVADVAGEGVWTLFPNPGNGDISLLYTADAGRVQVEVYDMTGRLMHTGQHVMVPGAPALLSLSGVLAPGTYVMRINGGFGTHEKRFVVQK